MKWNIPKIFHNNSCLSSYVWFMLTWRHTNQDDSTISFLHFFFIFINWFMNFINNLRNSTTKPPSPKHKFVSLVFSSNFCIMYNMLCCLNKFLKLRYICVRFVISIIWNIILFMTNNPIMASVFFPNALA
jgi:hypothetical protein